MVPLTAVRWTGGTGAGRVRRPPTAFAITTATYGRITAPTTKTQRNGPLTTTARMTQAVRTAIENR